MTDFFALFQMPRQPWLELDQLKQKYHELTRAAHPDVAVRENAHFQEINQAYRVLLDPKRRIQHLLELEAALANPNINVPAHLQELFPRVATVTQRSQTLLQQMANATGTLSKALLQPDLEEVRRKLQQLLEKLTWLQHERLAELREMNAIWNDDKTRGIERLRLLHDEISYLTRWSAQLNEAEFQLSLC